MDKLLFISHCVPYPPDKGERIRAFHELKALSQHFDITLAAVDHSGSDLRENVTALREFCREVMVFPSGLARSWGRGGLARLAGKSFSEGYFCPSNLRRAVLRETSVESPPLVVSYCSAMLPVALEARAQAHVADLVDLDSLKWASYAGKAFGLRRKWLHQEAIRVEALERRATRESDAVVLVSQAEASLLNGSQAKVMAAGNGVDAEYFTPRGAEGGSPFLVFVGTMNYRPNVEAVCEFVRRVWPGLRARLPRLSLTIVGRKPPLEVRKLQDAGGVWVTGAVKDVRPHLRRPAIAIAPLRTARGVQNKILESMAMGLPVVASSPAMAGLDAPLRRCVQPADSPVQWEQAIVQLVESSAKRQALGEASRECVLKHCRWPTQMAPLVERCLELVGRASARQQVRDVTVPRAPQPARLWDMIQERQAR